MKRTIKVGKRPINEGKRPIKAMVLVGISVGSLLGCFRSPPPWRKTAPPKRPIKSSFEYLCNHKHLSEPPIVGRQNPDLLFLAVLDFLAFFFLFKEILAFLSVFGLFSKDFRGSPARTNPCCFLRVSLFFQNGKEKKIREGVTPICSDCPVFFDLFRFALLVFGNTQICSDLLRFSSDLFRFCFQNKSEQIRATPFCRSLLQIPELG